LKKNKKTPLPSSYLKRMHKGLADYKQVYDKMIQLIDLTTIPFFEKYKLILDGHHPTGFDHRAWQDFQTAQLLGDIDSEEEFVEPFYVNPNDEQGKIILQYLKRSFAASLVLFDNFITTSYLYVQNRKLRHLLNFDNGETLLFLSKQENYFTKRENRRRIAWAIGAYFDYTNSSQEAAKSYDDEIIVHSYFYRQFEKISKLEHKQRGEKIKHLFDDYTKRISRVTVFELSKLFGNSLGIFASRKGKMLRYSHKYLDKLAHELRPLDILLEKTPFRLTDKFIPGHFGHVAMWVGTEQELKELGVWDSDIIRPYHKDIRAGKRVLEALRPGVELNTLHHFMNIDDFAVLRPKKLSLEQRRRYMLNGFLQVGKSYDFNFDVETDKRIVCSELAYVVYDDMQWPTENALGRVTISPDNVAVKALNGGPFEPVILFHDGKRIKHNIERNFEHLLKLEYDQVSFR
jgi:hypothetical protein